MSSTALDSDMTPPGDKKLVIATTLTAFQNDRLRKHRPDISLVEYSPAWQIPSEADVLMTGVRAWKVAPDSPPGEWPGKLRWIQSISAGVDGFPRWFLQGPIVTCARGVQAAAISEYVIGSILYFEKKMETLAVHSPDQWQTRRLGGFVGKTVGIMGMGAIAHEVATRSLAFGARVCAVSRSRRPVQNERIEMMATLEDVVAVSDHLVLALPLTNETRGTVGASLLAHAKPQLHLINIARGSLIDDAALLRALDAGQIAQATLDVTDPEPLPEGHPFYSHPRIRLTPHASGNSDTDELFLSRKICENLDRFIQNEALVDVVDPARGY